MNGYTIVAGLIASATTVGHFAVGSREFLKPMLEAPFDPVPKKVMHCVFHYVSAYLVLSAVTLLSIGFGIWPGTGSAAVTQFIAANYAVFAVWQVVLAIASDIENPMIKLFQWMFFVLIALFSFLGASL